MKFKYTASKDEDPELKEINFFGIKFVRNGPSVEVTSDHKAYPYLLINGQFEAVKEKVTRKIKTTR